MWRATRRWLVYFSRLKTWSLWVCDTMSHCYVIDHPLMHIIYLNLEKMPVVDFQPCSCALQGGGLFCSSWPMLVNVQLSNSLLNVNYLLTPPSMTFWLIMQTSITAIQAGNWLNCQTAQTLQHAWTVQILQHLTFKVITVLIFTTINYMHKPVS